MSAVWPPDQSLTHFLPIVFPVPRICELETENFEIIGDPYHSREEIESLVSPFELVITVCQTISHFNPVSTQNVSRLYSDVNVNKASGKVNIFYYQYWDTIV